MEPVQPPNQKQSWARAFLFLAFLVILFVGFFSRKAITSFLGIPDIEGPGVDPPLYFARQDFVGGISAGIGEGLALTLAALTSGRFRKDSLTILGTISCFFLPSFADACVIYLRCPRIMHVKDGTCAWETFQQFQHDPAREAVFCGTLALLFVLAFISRRNRP